MQILKSEVFIESCWDDYSREDIHTAVESCWDDYSREDMHTAVESCWYILK